MTFLPFPALLRSSYNMIHEYGYAALSADGDAVEFRGDFVPLIPLGHSATIQWVLGGNVLATFEGNVYLSSSTLLRLVDVDKKALATIGRLLASNTSLPGTLTPAENGLPTQQDFYAEIVYLSMRRIKLLTGLELAPQSNLFLHANVDFLTLDHLGLQVEEQTPLNKDSYLTLCSVVSGGDDNFVTLSAYVAKLTLLPPG